MDDWVDSANKPAEALPVQGFEPHDGAVYGHQPDSDEVSEGLPQLKILSCCFLLCCSARPARSVALQPPARC
jgi:hypothetical protein